MLKVQYVRTFDDYVDYALYRSRVLLSVRNVISHKRTALSVALLTAAVMMAFLVDQPLVVVAFDVILFAVGVFAWVWVPKTVWAKVRAATRLNVADMGIGTTTVELMLTEDVLVMTADGMRAEIGWDRMKSVDVVGDTTYIILTAGMAAIVPRDGFERDRDYFAVQQFALRKLGGELPPDD